MARLHVSSVHKVSSWPTTEGVKAIRLELTRHIVDSTMTIVLIDLRIKSSELLSCPLFEALGNNSSLGT